MRAWRSCTKSAPPTLWIGVAGDRLLRGRVVRPQHLVEFVGDFQRFDRLAHGEATVGRLDLADGDQRRPAKELVSQRQRFESATANVDADFQYVVVKRGRFERARRGDPRPTLGGAASVGPPPPPLPA